jgi:hypothetical protein
MQLASQKISDQAMAYREAGYTVACWSLGFRVKRATITSHGKPSEFLTWLRAARFSCNSGLSRRSMMRYHDRIVCTLAGLQAQRHVTPKGTRTGDAHSDEVIVANLLLRLHGEERERSCAFRYLQARARNFVNNQWPLIEHLAKVLIEHKIVTSKELLKMLREHRIAQAI